MRSADLLALSFRTVTSHKLRSSLTALGLIIGIAAVVILTSIGRGIHTFVLAEFTQFGTQSGERFPRQEKHVWFIGRNDKHSPTLGFSGCSQLEQAGKYYCGGAGSTGQCAH